MVEVALVIIILALLVDRCALRKSCKLLKMKLEENGQMPTSEDVETFVQSEMKETFRIK